MDEPYPLVSNELSENFRAAMRRLAACVCIVVAKGDRGPAGIAATSVTSLTLDPPAVLVCVNRAASVHALLGPTASLSVNLLARQQRDVSAAFGGGLSHDERFAVGEWVDGSNGLPRLVGAQANLECVIDLMLSYGTHSIVVARVLQAQVRNEVAPLIYQDGEYL